MTLAIFLPIALAVVAIIDLIAFRMMLNKGSINERMFTWLALASVSLPIIAYIVLNSALPDIGAIEVF